LRSPLVDEFVACWKVVMTTHSESLFLVALDRARELQHQIPWDDLDPDECRRIVLDAAVVALNWEFEPFESEAESLTFLAEQCNGHDATGFFMPEFHRTLRRSA
jgi:hypothetical protein